MKKHWKVGDLAKMAGLTVRTLRFYDQIELFSPSGYSESGHRLYTEADIARLHQILSLKELGLSLEQIKSILAGDQFSPFQIVSMQIERLKETIRLQQKLVDELEHVSRLMLRQEPLTVDDFTQLLGTMKRSHEKFFAERQATWERQLDQLGLFLEDNPEED